MERFVESKAKTNKLWCSDCGKDIKKGEDVIFKLDSDEKMLEVFCCNCLHRYMIDVIHSEEHPFSSEALGQE